MADQIPDSAKSDMSWIDIAVLGQKRGVVIVDYAPGWSDFMDELHFADAIDGNEPDHLTPGAYRWTGFTIGSWQEGDRCVVKGGTFTRAAPPAMDREAVERIRALVAEIDAGKFDELDAVADKWSAEAGVQRMSNAICSVFEGYASQDVMDRFREKVAALMHLSFVEGAAQGVLQLKPAIAHDETLRSIFAKHTRIGGYPDTDAIARDAYNLALSTVCADAIRQGEGTFRPYNEWNEDDHDVLWWMLPVQSTPYLGSPLDLGFTVGAQLYNQFGDVIGKTEANVGGWPFSADDEANLVWSRLPATPASHASDGGKA